jgi:CheY-like chemotaxis protein
VKKEHVFFIADDDLDDQELFIKALKEIDNSCYCITALNGEDALYKLENEKHHPPDLIFLDLNMPKVNGKQCLKAIKLNQDLKDIPVIIYSTSAEKKEIQETTQLGAAFFMQKPNRFIELRSALNQIILHNWS